MIFPNCSLPKCLTHLGKLTFGRAQYLMADLQAAPRQLVAPDVWLALLVASWLDHLGCFDELTVHRLVCKMHPALREQCELGKIEWRIANTARSYLICIADQRYAWWHEQHHKAGEIKLYDIRTETFVDQADYPPVTTVVLDLDNLVRQKAELMERAANAHTAKDGPERPAQQS